MTKHPAKFSKELLPLLAELVGDRRPVLDPMAGTGKIAEVIQDPFMVELEPEWAEEARNNSPFSVVHTGDARNMYWFPDDFFGAVVTSPTYGNRMADHHEAKDLCKSCNGAGGVSGPPGGDPCIWCRKCNGTGLSRRNTYTHTLGRKLSEGNTGAMQWGQEYRDVHADIWAEVYRVLAPGGRFVLNVKDFIRKGERVRVSDWHLACCRTTGFNLEKCYEVECPGNRNGANGHLRVPAEDVFVLEKP